MALHSVVAPTLTCKFYCSNYFIGALHASDNHLTCTIYQVVATQQTRTTSTRPKCTVSAVARRLPYGTRSPQENCHSDHYFSTAHYWLNLFCLRWMTTRPWTFQFALRQIRCPLRHCPLIAAWFPLGVMAFSIRYNYLVIVLSWNLSVSDTCEQWNT